MIATDRLVLRMPEPDDLAWQQIWLNTPAVMRHLGGVRSSDAVAAGVAQNAKAWAEDEPAFWTVVLRTTGAVIGKCGLSWIHEDLAPPSIYGAVQIGWSLAEPFWGQGYASEAARAVLRHGFEAMALAEIWAQTSDSNAASTRMMARLGLIRQPDLSYSDPDYPVLDNPAVVYRLTRAEWLRAT